MKPHWADDPTSADDYSRMVDDAADEVRDRAHLADDEHTPPHRAFRVPIFRDPWYRDEVDDEMAAVNHEHGRDA